MASGHHGGQHRSWGLAQVQTHGQNQKRAGERKSLPTEETPAGRGPAWTSSLAAHWPLRRPGRAWASRVPASWPPGGPASGPPPPGSSAGPPRPPRGPAPPASASQSARTAWGQRLQVTAAQQAGGTRGAPGMLRGPGHQVLFRPEPVSAGWRLIHGLAEQGVRPRWGKCSQEASSPVRVPPAPPPWDGESWAPSERNDGGREGWGPRARVSFPQRAHRGSEAFSQPAGWHPGQGGRLPCHGTPPRPLVRSRDRLPRGPPEAGLLLGALPLGVLERLLPPDLGQGLPDFHQPGTQEAPLPGAWGPPASSQRPGAGWAAFGVGAWPSLSPLPGLPGSRAPGL